MKQRGQHSVMRGDNQKVYRFLQTYQIIWLVGGTQAQATHTVLTRNNKTVLAVSGHNQVTHSQ